MLDIGCGTGRFLAQLAEVAKAWGVDASPEMLDVARSRGLREMIGHVLAENRSMLALCDALGFSNGESTEGPQVRRVSLALQPR